jgi:hypothetical protein
MGGPFYNCWICAICNKTTVLFSKARILFWPPYRDLLSAPIQPIGSRLGLGLGVAKISRWPPLHPREGGFEMGSVVTMAPADVTNLPLILHSAPILTPWSKLSYLIFWPLTWLSFWLNFQRSFEPFCNSIQALPPNSGSWLWKPLHNRHSVSSRNGIQPQDNPNWNHTRYGVWMTKLKLVLSSLASLPRNLKESLRQSESGMGI